MRSRSTAPALLPAPAGMRARPALPRCATRPELSLVIPAHNEEAVIAETLRSYIALLEERALPYEILVVLNGCTDRTWERVVALSRRHPHIGYVLLREPGKGNAVKTGFQLARGEYVGFVDADGQIPPTEFAKLLFVLERMPELDGVIASKYGEPWLHAPGAASPLRHLSGRVFNLLVQALLGLPYRDTQCGAKVFRRRALEDVLAHLTYGAWTFDVELLFYLHRLGRRVAEIPISLRPGGRPSQIRALRVAPQMLRDVLELRFRAPGGLKSKAARAAQAGRRARLGEILCRLGAASPEEIERALERQRREGSRLGEILLRTGLVAPEEVQLALALQRA